jgi:hypothetical protein
MRRLVDKLIEKATLNGVAFLLMSHRENGTHIRHLRKAT